MRILTIVVCFFAFCVYNAAVFHLGMLYANGSVTEAHTEQTLNRQFDQQWSNWVKWEMGKCLVKHYPHMADAKECMMKAGIVI